MVDDGCTLRVTPDYLRVCCQRAVDLPDESLQLAIDEVLEVFDYATDGHFRGVCTSTIQPLGSNEPCGASSLGRDEILRQVWPAYLPPMLPYVKSASGPLGGPTLANCWYSCNADNLSSIRLPWLPTVSVIEVRIDGAVFTDWRLLPGTNLLVRTDGDRWPDRQDLTVEPGEPGTWTVQFEHGRALPVGAIRRIAGFACLIARYCAGQDCQLPEGVKVIRKGDYEFAVKSDYREHGLTGYEPLDDWIAAWRGGTKDSRARIKPSISRPGGSRHGSIRT